MAANPVTNLTSVFCPPLPGKPDPYAVGDSRTRVPQSGQKGNTCVYYALQILRNEHRIGKNPSENQLDKRRIEINISKYRKAFTKVDNLFNLQIIPFAGILTKSVGGGRCTQQQARQFIENRSPQIHPENRQVWEEWSTSVRFFCSQSKHDDFSSFIQEIYQKALIGVHEQFFHDFNAPLEYIEKKISEHLGKPWAEISTQDKEHYERKVVVLESYRVYGCKKSSWHPEQPIEKLIEQLHLRGPHFVTGEIGNAYYQEAPSQLPEKIEGRSIFSWGPNAPRKKMGPTHAVVIVGAKVDHQDGELVYFLDPHDGSDPKDMSTQKIYAISYEELKTSIATVDGRKWTSDDDGQPVFLVQKEDENQYALYMPKKLS